ncbi:hypothetical protein CERSUDRAFT_115316 [Gelatoporia subvermispora B]|uniref:Uncharacterized protein n=1 Tax=Ceriporiopsis subvermispora (strain B) TaxID=914234 RepID=M2PJH3_CERS8|nr:hypothetical protein CERSUDRAFT_115316 [Gelatoporia subvermispora B]
MDSQWLPTAPTRSPRGRAPRVKLFADQHDASRSHSASHKQFSPAAVCGILDRTMPATPAASAHRMCRAPAQYFEIVAYTVRSRTCNVTSARPYTQARAAREPSPTRRADTRYDAPTPTAARRSRARAYARSPHGPRDKTCIRTSRSHGRGEGAPETSGRYLALCAEELVVYCCAAQ